MHRIRLVALVALVTVSAGQIASIAPASAEPNPNDALLCQAATSRAEHATFVPDQLLGAISRVESGRADAWNGAIRAWPWTINAEGVGHYYDTKAEAVAAARAFQAAGIRSIDIGCTQINLMFHPDAFSSLDQGFDPGANAMFAAGFLLDLFHQTGSWPHAAAAYHSQTPNLGSDYQRKVLEVWAEPDGAAAAGPARSHGVGSGGVIGTGRGASRGASPGASPGANPGSSRGSSRGNGDGTSGTIASASPFSARPLGGYGRIIRNGPITVPGAGGMGIVAGSLAAYRARPVALASLRPPPS